MASLVFVIDSTARRAQIRVGPNTYLSDVVEEARKKLGASTVNYGLKHNGKTVDLSRNFRLSGLSSGAKLQLVQLSRSVSVVSVALQLPESDGHARLTDKFPSDTTLWLILRKFEAGVAGGGSPQQNITARGAPAFNEGSAASGRIYYHKPLIHVMGREFSSFTDLQKTLSQLGFNGGSVLLRLSFQMSDTPLEEAMEQMSAYFKDSLSDGKDGEGSDLTNKESLESVLEKSAPTAELETSAPAPVVEAPEPDNENHSAPITTQAASTSDKVPSDQQQDSPPKRTVQIFSPPSSNTPSATLTSYNPADYIPSIEHARTHQQNLKARSHNTRLPSEAELAAGSAAEAEKLQAIKDVEIKVRFPDQSSAITTFHQSDTGSNLYSFVRNDCLDEKWKHEKFVLVYAVAQKGFTALPDTDSKRLIQDLGLKQKVLVIFKWDDAGGASPAALRTKDVLNAERRREAQAIRPPVVLDAKGQDEEGVVVDLAKGRDEGAVKKSTGVPKWLKLPGKK